MRYLKDLVTECDQKSKDFESRQMLRAEEIEAINKAREGGTGGTCGRALVEQEVPSVISLRVFCYLVRHAFESG